MIIASDIQQENRTECASRVLTLTAETRNSGYIPFFYALKCIMKFERNIYSKKYK